MTINKLYYPNHPSGYRLWGYDDESICFNDDQPKFGRELFWLQDEPELYNQVLALCIKYYHDNKERIEKEKLLR